MKNGVIYLKIKLQLEYDIDDAEVAQLVQELEYEMNDKRIQNTEIVDYTTDANESI